MDFTSFTLIEILNMDKIIDAGFALGLWSSALALLVVSLFLPLSMYHELINPDQKCTNQCACGPDCNCGEK